jgi:hypothetical protein
MAADVRVLGSGLTSIFSAIIGVDKAVNMGS